MRAIRVLVVALALGGLARPGAAQQPPAEGAPLVMAIDDRPRIEFQVGADAFGGGMADIDFIGGVNATFVYPALDWLWVGIRPALHYVFVGDSPYDQTWMHADAALQFNLLHDPLRVYLLAAGGYCFALNSNTPDLSHGFSVLGGVGAAWQPQDSRVGLFLELGFRYGAASDEASRLVLDEQGQPVYDEDSMSWRTERYDHEFELMALTFNIGLTVSP